MGGAAKLAIVCLVFDFTPRGDDITNICYSLHIVALTDMVL